MGDHVQFECEVAPRDARRKRWLTRWTQTRQRGRLSYMLRRGILVHGTIFAVWMTLARVFGLFGERQSLRIPLLLLRFVFYAVFFGLWMGFCIWHLHEKRFRELSDA